MPPDPRYAHSFAVFVKTVECEGKCTLEYHALSWLSVTGKIRVTALRPEPGRIYGLHETFQLVLSKGERISLWGPFEIKPELYNRFMDQYNHLQSGKVRYKALDYFRSSRRVTNCFHALSSMAQWTRLRVIIPNWGETASYHVARRYRRWMICPEKRHLWLVGALGLEQYPMIYRDWRHPRSGALRTKLRNILWGRGKLSEYVVAGYVP